MRHVRYLAAVVGLSLWVGCPYTEGCEAGSAPGDNPEGGTSGSSGSSGTSGTANVPKGPIEPNCKGLDAKCNGESCCTASNIPGGTFNRLNDPKFPATVSEFRLDVYEVTVGRFRSFVNAGMGVKKKAPAPGSGKNPNDPDDEGWDEKWNDFLSDDTDSLVGALQCDNQYYPAFDPTPGKNDSLPMNCETWPEAQAFCIWDGGRLPTEAEWSYAAAGGDEQRVTPDGSTAASKDLISFGCWSGGSEAEAKKDDPAVPECTFKDYLPVGSKKDGRGRWGQQDMSGSNWERMFDWYADAMPTPCTDCALHADPGTVSNPSSHVFRGGSLNWPKIYQVTTNRGTADLVLSETMTDRTNTVGFRCARVTTK